MPGGRLAEIVAAAESIRDTEKRQAEIMRGGTGLREQLRFREYLDERAANSAYGFREHLRKIGGAVEE